jgi:phytochrome-interacting factor 3
MWTYFLFWVEQMMSIRTGMTLPPMVVPSGLQQHMQMPQMATMPSMGMGMGMVPMGLGMGMMDMAPQQRAVMPMQSHPGPSLNGNMASTSSLVDVHGYQQPGVMDYNSYMARQHQPMQMTQVRSVSNAA